MYLFRIATLPNEVASEFAWTHYLDDNITNGNVVFLIVQDTGSTSIQAADSTAINGNVTPTDKR